MYQVISDGRTVGIFTFSLLLLFFSIFFFMITCIIFVIRKKLLKKLLKDAYKLFLNSSSPTLAHT